MKLVLTARFLFDVILYLRLVRWAGVGRLRTLSVENICEEYKKTVPLRIIVRRPSIRRASNKRAYLGQCILPILVFSVSYVYSGNLQNKNNKNALELFHRATHAL